MITAEIMSTEIDIQKNAVIWICFKDDKGNEIPFWRGTELLVKDGHKVWPLMTGYGILAGQTTEQMQKWIQISVEHQIGNIIKAAVKPTLNTAIISSVNALIGVKFQKDSTEMLVDPDSTGVPTAVATIKDDGTFTVVAVT